MTFSGSTAIVTGGASGIGLAISERLARRRREGVGLRPRPRAGRPRRAGHPRQGRRGDRVRGRRLGPRPGRRRRWSGRVRELGSGARPGERGGQGRLRPVHRHHAPSCGSAIIAVNLTGTFHCTQAALPDMLDGEVGPHREHLVVERADRRGDDGALLVVEGGGDRPDEDAGARARAARHHGQHHPARRHRHADEPPRRRGRAIRWRHAGRRRSPLPVRRIGVPEDIAAACAYLVSDEAGYVTGQIIGVNGGRVT